MILRIFIFFPKRLHPHDECARDRRNKEQDPTRAHDVAHMPERGPRPTGRTERRASVRPPQRFSKPTALSARAPSLRLARGQGDGRGTLQDETRVPSTRLPHGSAATTMGSTPAAHRRPSAHIGGTMHPRPHQGNASCRPQGRTCAAASGRRPASPSLFFSLPIVINAHVVVALFYVVEPCRLNGVESSFSRRRDAFWNTFRHRHNSLGRCVIAADTVFSRHVFATKRRLVDI